MKVVHFITRLIIGGAQENTLHTVEDQHTLFGDQVALVSGPGIGPEGSLVERASRGGFDLRILPELGRSILPWQDLLATRRFLDILRELRPEIVHTHSSKAGILGRWAAAKLKIPCIHTIHGASFHYGQNPIAHRVYIAAEKWAAKRTAHFISVADDMTDEYVRAGVATIENFTTVYSGFDVEPFLNPPRPREEVRRELGIAPDEIVIGKIARLFHLKGHEFVLKVAGEVLRQHPRVKFLFVGDGILRPQLEAAVNAAGWTDRFVFVGLVPPTKIPELVTAMDVVVHTSQWEGLARVLPQGLIAGKPVVTYDVGGAREVVIPNVTGYLLPRNFVTELATALSQLAGDAALRERLGAEGRARFTETFRHQTMTRRIREVYEKVINRSLQKLHG